MAEVISRSSMVGAFEPVLVKDLIDKVKGKSVLAALSQQTPIPFSGMKEYTFTMDDEIDVVAEGGKKSRGSMSFKPVTIVPIKVEYGARLTDEFMIASEEEQINILKAFNDGFAKKLAKGFDLMALHGINPRTGEASALIGENHFDAKVTQKVYTPAADAPTPDAQMEAAIAMIQANEEDATGAALAPAFRSKLAAMVDKDNRKLFPELAWGSTPGQINGLPVEVSANVAAALSGDLAVIGNFADYFRWGYAKEIPTKIIEYGDPDNSGRDLQGHNEVYMRAEAYIGWGILEPEAFSIISDKTGSEEDAG